MQTTSEKHIQIQYNWNSSYIAMCALYLFAFRVRCEVKYNKICERGACATIQNIYVTHTSNSFGGFISGEKFTSAEQSSNWKRVGNAKNNPHNQNGTDTDLFKRGMSLRATEIEAEKYEKEQVKMIVRSQRMKWIGRIAYDSCYKHTHTHTLDCATFHTRTSFNAHFIYVWTRELRAFVLLLHIHTFHFWNRTKYARIGRNPVRIQTARAGEY